MPQINAFLRSVERDPQDPLRRRVGEVGVPAIRGKADRVGNRDRGEELAHLAAEMAVDGAGAGLRPNPHRPDPEAALRVRPAVVRPGDGIVGLEIDKPLGGLARDVIAPERAGRGEDQCVPVHPARGRDVLVELPVPARPVQPLAEDVEPEELAAPGVPERPLSQRTDEIHHMTRAFVMFMQVNSSQFNRFSIDP